MVNPAGPKHPQTLIRAGGAGRAGGLGTGGLSLHAVVNLVGPNLEWRICFVADLQNRKGIFSTQRRFSVATPKISVVSIKGGNSPSRVSQEYPSLHILRSYDPHWPKKRIHRVPARSWDPGGWIMLCPCASATQMRQRSRDLRGGTSPWHGFRRAFCCLADDYTLNTHGR